MTQRVAVLLPCYNEEQTIGTVVRAFRASLPDALIFVYDNNSTDQTAACAAEAGAIVRREPKQGKGNVTRRMFADIDADIYVIADGDGTYDAGAAPQLVSRLIDEQLDMVVGARRENGDDEGVKYRPGHRLGNALFNRVVSRLFGVAVGDMLSGFRAFSRRFVKTFPALASGFEIETEITIHALELRMPIAEIELPYGSRPEGSTSKLNTWWDGFRILATIMFLYKEVRPFRFFGMLFALLAAFSLIIMYPVIVTYLDTGLVPRIPTTVLATGTMLLGFIMLASGIILDTVSRGRREAKRLHYLSIAAPGSPMDQISGPRPRQAKEH
jgi:glycosyltransferase involved in cell wall biosynthesis